MNNHGALSLKKIATLKSPLAVAVSTCLLVACGSASKTTPSNTSVPINATTASTPWNESSTEITSTGLDAETLAILNDLLEARDMSMVEGDRIAVERYGNLWDRIRRGYRLATPVNNARIEAQKSWFGGKQDYLNRLTARASRYLHHTVTEAERRGIPTELALLPIIESSYDPSATSNASAAGLWQFIPSTGRIYGLNQSTTYDGRRDVIESTRAAYDFLTSLYNQFGSWELALAAYNAGPGRIQRAIDANRALGLPTDYWSLKLPTETMNYVPRFMAVAQIIGNPSQYNVSFPAIANHAHFRAVPVNVGVSLQEVSGITGVPVQELQLLNPALTSLRVDIAGPSRVVIPTQVPSAIDAQLSALSGYGSKAPTVVNTTYIRPDASFIPNPESIQVLKQTNTLPTTKATITAQKTIVQEPPLSKEERDFIADQIRKNTSGVEPVNVKDGNIELEAVQTGQSVLETQGKTKSLHYDKAIVVESPNIVPSTPSATPAYEPPTTTIVPAVDANLSATPIYQPPAYTPPTVKATTHRVQSGDTLTSIAQRYGVTVQELRDWNGMTNDALFAGRTLKLYDDGSSRVMATPVPTSRPAPVPTSRPAVTPTPKKADSYTIQAGDTLTGVAMAHGLSVAQLASYNNLDTNARLVRGQKLWLVAGKVAPKPVATPASTTTTKTYKGKTTTYKVQRGDTLLGLANRLGVTADDIASLNESLGANDNLVAGQTITVPAVAPAKPTRSEPAKETKEKRYTIASGDTLIGVANRHNIDVETLASANNLGRQARLVAGQSLIIPAGNTKQATTSSAQSSSNSSQSQSVKFKTESYKVQSGDTLTSLAGRYGVSVAELATVNDLGRNARLNAGQTIKVPKLTTTHTVSRGESLISLAKRYGIEVAELAKMNNLSPNDGLKIGQKLTVPNR